MQTMNVSPYSIKAGDEFSYCGTKYTATADAHGEFNTYIPVAERGGEIIIAHGDTVTMPLPEPLKVDMKIKASTWLGRTVYRAYYKTPGGKWARFGGYEAATPLALRNIIDRIERSATLVWKDDAK